MPNDTRTIEPAMDSAALAALRQKKQELDLVCDQLLIESEKAIERIEYGEITDRESIEEVMDLLLDHTDLDYSYNDLFRRLHLFLYFNSETFDPEFRRAQRRLFLPRYRLSDEQSNWKDLRHYKNAFGFIRTSQKKPRESVEKQRREIQEYCKAQGIKLKATQAFIGPKEKSGEMLDFALTEMVRNMCDILIVSDIFRFGRDAKEVDNIINALREKGITVYSSSQGDITDFQLQSGTDEIGLEEPILSI